MTDNGPVNGDNSREELRGLSSGAPVQPVTPGKPRIAWGYFILGLATPFVAWGLLIALAGVFDSMTGVFPVVAGALFFAQLLAAIIGGREGDTRLRSFGFGGLWAYGLVVLIGLLVFGTCVIGLSN
jgi:hypothetical protein